MNLENQLQVAFATITELTSERDAALLAAKHQRGKRFGSKSERDKGDGNA